MNSPILIIFFIVTIIFIIWVIYKPELLAKVVRKLWVEKTIEVGETLNHNYKNFTGNITYINKNSDTAIFWTHGGAFVCGKRGRIPKMLSDFDCDVYYYDYPEKFKYDIDTTMNYIKNIIDTYSSKYSKFILGGDSAGAFLSYHLSFEVNPTQLILASPFLIFKNTNKILKKLTQWYILSKSKRVFNPTTYIKIPSLIITSKQDILLPMAQDFKKYNNTAKYLEYDCDVCAHVFYMQDIQPDIIQQIVDEVNEFIK